MHTEEDNSDLNLELFTQRMEGVNQDELIRSANYLYQENKVGLFY